MSELSKRINGIKDKLDSVSGEITYGNLFLLENAVDRFILDTKQVNKVTETTYLNFMVYVVLNPKMGVFLNNEVMLSYDEHEKCFIGERGHTEAHYSIDKYSPIEIAKEFMKLFN